MIEWSAKLGALEALERGCTAIIDHHESPNAIEGSLSVIADACAEVGVRVSTAYGVTDRHGAEGARRGLDENDRYLSAGGRGHGRRPRRVHVHRRHAGGGCGVGHEARRRCAHPRRRGTRRRRSGRPHPRPDPRRLAARARRAPRRRPRPRGHDRPQPSLEHEQRRRVRPSGTLREPGRARHRRHRRRHARRVPSRVRPPPRARRRSLTRVGVVVAGDQPCACSRKRSATACCGTTSRSTRGASRSPPESSPSEVRVDGAVVYADGAPTRVDAAEIRAKAAEAAQRLFARL